MDHADDDGDDNGNNDVFVYTGGEVPRHLRRTTTHVRIHKSVKKIIESAFEGCKNLMSVEMHDGVEIIEGGAFDGCKFLRGIKLTGVRVIGHGAFYNCTALTDVDFGDKLETIAELAFSNTSLRNIKLPNVRSIGNDAFSFCKQLTEVELSEDLETIGEEAFYNCPRLRRIALPCLRRIALPWENNLLGVNVFSNCPNLSQVDLVGGIHKTISSLLLDSWRNKMNEEINRINQDLPNTRGDLPNTSSNENTAGIGPFPPADRKTVAIQDWLEIVLLRIDHYKSEHYKLLKQFTTLLELALWKAKLDEMVNVKDNIEMQAANMVINDNNSARRELRITSGANIVIKNVLPFLIME